MAFLVAFLLLPGIYNFGWGQTSQTYITSGSFTVPAGVTSITVECWGGGGAGGGSNSNNNGGGGGGGGGYTTASLTVIPGQSINFTVGAGGTGVTSNNGNNGTSTQFLTLTANGGTGGVANRGAFGIGGTATGGTTNTNGSNGLAGGDSGGNGGAGANGGAGGTGSTNANGGNGTLPGGGGGGGERGGGNNRAGGAGGDGQIKVTWTIPTSYYSSGNDNAASVNSWWTNTNGTGSQPANFSSNNQRFVIQSGNTYTTSALWNVTGSINNTIEIQNGGKLVAANGKEVTGTASFSILSGGTLEIGNAAGITSSGATGSIQCSGTRSFDSGANYIYSGSAAQVTGSGLPTSVNDLTINNSAGVSLSGSETINGTLTLTSGNFAVGANTLTLNGPAIMGTPSNLLTTSASSLVFGGAASSVNIPSSVALLNSLTINNINGVTQNSSITLSDNPALTLTSGILYLGTNSLRVTNTATDAVSPGSSTSYLSGGSLSRVLNNTGTNIYFPVGNSTCGGLHQFTLNNPSISAGSELKVTYACTGVGGADMVTLSSLPFPYNWKLELVSGTFTSTDIKLESSDIDLSHTIGVCGIQGGNYSLLANSTSAPGSLTATSLTTLPNYFTPGISLRKTYYSYQSGNWDVVTTWTIDPSGTLSLGASVPTATDNVVILNGRTVNITSNNKACISLDIKNGGILNLGLTTGHSFVTLNGQGIIKTQSVLPTVTNFNFNQSGGGTVEYNNPSIFSFATTVYNNLIINLLTSTLVATLTDDMTIYGNLTVQQGILQINDNTANSRIFTTNGNVAVKSNGRIQLGTGNVNHRFIVNGDFTNEGTVRFTNQTNPNYTSTPNDGRSDVVFNNATSNQNLVCNGLSDFYRIEIDKGIDDTYILNIDANNAGNFNLYGENDFQTSPPSMDAPNVPNSNALGLLAGTVRLGSNIILPCLAANAVYNIDLDAQIWIDGATVTYSSVTSNSSIVIYGKLRVSNNGTLIANGYQGIVMRDQSAVYMESGTVTTSCIRTSAIIGIHRGAFVMSGGTINITGNTNFAGTGMYASFSLPYPDNVFRMSGGTININSPTTTTGSSGYNFSLLFGSDAKNAQLSGGTINVTVLTGRNSLINSTIPFWDLNIISSSSAYSAQIYAYAGNGSPVIPAIAAQPLIVLHDLTIQNSGVLNAVSNNVSVGHDFVIASTATYTPGTNLTTFNGTTLQTFSNLGTITSGLNNLAITQTSNTGIAKDLTVLGTLLVDQDASFNDNGLYTYIAGNITNSGSCLGQPAGGGIRMNGTTMQQIYGDGSGIFNHLIIDNNLDATTNCNISLTGNLRLINTAILDIGGNSLSMSSNSNVYDGLTGTTQTGFNSSKMLKSSGLQSDGGIIKQFGSLTSFLYPIGTGTLYTPVTTQFFTAPTTWGKIALRPVNMRHPLAQGSLNALPYYWQLDTLGFVGVAANSVTHTFNYASLIPVPGTESLYLPAYYDSQWNTLAAAYMNTVSHSATFDRAAMNFTSGSYTVGMASAFFGLKTYYSRSAAPNIGTTGANWNTASTWSSDPVLKWNGAQDGSIPGVNSVVIIGDGTVSHLVTISANSAKAGNLVIATNSTLDIASTTGHNFGSIPNSRVSGKGTLRLSSATFPQGDWDLFLSNGGGTVEYYTPTTAANLTLPSSYLSPSGIAINFTSYNNLIFTPTSGNYISMPSGVVISNLNVYGNFTAQGAGLSQFNRTVNTQNLVVNGDMTVKSGATLQYYSTSSQNVTVVGNISNSGTFNIGNIGTATNSLTVSGNLVNNGSFDMLPGTGQSGNVNFKNVANTQVSGTTATMTRFNSITVDKGTNRNSILDVTVNNTNFSLNTALANAISLTNGTFRLSNGANLTLSTNSDYSIPTTGCISVNNGTVNFSNITGTNTTSYDLLLNGRLEVLGTGVVNVGNSTNNVAYDIEYSSGGTPEIFVLDQGTLNVYGQIRRPLLISTGALSYNQSGTSNVTVYGQNANSAKGMFEVQNTGSNFSMSGGTLTIARSFNGTTNDIYINPSNYSITDGTLQLGATGVTTAGSNYYFAISCPVGTLSVGVIGLDITANQQIFELKTINDLTINSSGSVYKANGINVTIGRDLINKNSNTTAGIGNGGYLAGSTSQNTIFNGTSAQNISGIGSPRNLTNFGTVLINKTGTLSLISGNSNIRINGNLTLSSGRFEDNGNVISLNGNVTNNSEHSSSISGGGISFVGSSKQTIFGNGSGVFGNMMINNGNGIDMTASSTINGLLNFNIDNGFLYIDDYLLTLGQSASASGNNSLRYIRLNGALSDLGVVKFFNAGAQPAFVFPIGVVNKYTPATYTIAANSASGTSSIRLKPVNSKHPSTNELPPVTDELQYYWNVTSTGFVSPTISHTYKYINSDALPDETGYVVGRFDNSNPTVPVWSIPTGSSVNTGSDLITIPSSTTIDGEYTCGVNSNFVNLPTYYSRNAASNITTTGANWNSLTSWTISSDGSGAAVTALPSGNTMVILSGHRINMDLDYRKAYAVNIYGSLDVGTTLYHSLGHISGTGRIRIAANAGPNNTYVFPGGFYDNFMGTSGTVIEFYGANDATLPLKPGNFSKPFQNVEFSDNSTKYVSAENMKILGNLAINTNGGFLDNSLYNKEIQISGDWIDLKSTAGFVPGTGKVTFAGSSAQGIKITNNFAESFYNLGINNSSTGVTLSGSGRVEVSNNLVLTNGVFTTNSTNTISLTNTSPNVVVGGSSSSFVKGPLNKNISSGSYFNFPVGDVTTRNRYGNIVLLSTATSGSKYWTAQYYDSGYSDITTKVDPISSVSSNEYWRLNGVAGASANVRLRWDSFSDLVSTVYSLRQKLRVAEYVSPAPPNGWTMRGQYVNDPNQTVESTSSFTLNGEHYVTLGITSVPTVKVTSSTTVSVCNNDGIANISLVFTDATYAPFSYAYTIDGGAEQIVTGASSSAILQLNAATLGGVGVHTVALTKVWDNTNTLGITRSPNQVVITVNANPAIGITGPATAGTSTTQTYSTTADADTYSWSLSGGGTISGTGSTRSINWTSAGTFTLQVTKAITSTGCSSVSTLLIVVSSTPNPVISGNAITCIGTSETYQVTNNSGNTYSWKVDGASSGGSTNSITVSFSTSGAHTVSVKECNGSNCTTTSDYSVNVGAFPLDRTVTVPTATCLGGTVAFTVQNTESTVTYQLVNATTNSNIGLAVAGNGGNINLPVTPAASTNYYINAVQQAPYNCVKKLNSTNYAVTVNALPTVTITNPATVCSPSTVNLTAAAVTAGSTAGLTYTYWTDAAATIAYATPATAPAGTYYIKGTTALGCFAIKPVVVTVNPTPTITTAGTATTVCYNTGLQTTTLTYTATTNNPTSYNIDWNAVANTAGLADQVSTALAFVASGGSINSIAITAGTLAGSYSGIMTITNTNGCINTQAVTITVNSLPSITVQPTVPSAVCSGTGTQTISVTTTGTGLTYSWRKGGVALVNGGVIAGQGTSTLTLTSPTTTDAGSYDVVVSGTCTPAVISNTVAVAINTAPVITVQPAVPAAVCSGTGTQTISVTTTGTGLTYSWRKGGAALINGGVIAGQGTATLSLTNPTTTDAGSYDVVVSGTCMPAVTSNTVAVAINTAPVITVQPTAPTAVCSGTGTQTISVNATGTGLTYSWRKGGVALVNGGVIAGQGTATLTLTSPTTTDAGSYDVVVSGTCTPAVTSSAVTVAINTATAITSQSTATQKQCITGTFAAISVTASGTGTLNYQWYSNTTATTTGGTSLGIANGAQTSSFTPQASTAGALYYYCIVTGTCGTVTSAVSGAFIVTNSATISLTPSNESCPANNDGTISTNLSGGLTNIRYIKITQQNADWTNLADLQAIESFTGTNLSLGATASASSTYGGGSYPASEFIDGITSDGENMWHSGSSNIGEWINIDLGSKKNIDYLRIYNRVGCCQNRAQNLLLELFDASNNLVYNKVIDVYEGINGPHFIDINILDLNWTDSGTPLNRSGLNPGSYTLNYADAVGCTTSTTTTISTTNSVSAAPASITGTTTICNGNSTTLSASGGSLGTGAAWKWYSGSCGGTLAGTGSSITVSPATSITYFVRAEGTCNTTACLSVTVTVTPTVTISAFAPATSTRCQGAGVVTTTTTANNSTGITYSLDAASLTGLNTINAATGAVNYAATWSGTTTITASAAGCNGPVTTTHIVTVIPDGSWIGTIDSDWNNPANWACNQLPSITTNVLIANGKSHYPVLSSGTVDKTNNLTIENGATLTVSGNTLQIAGAITNNGTFTATTGTIEMKGSAAQSIDVKVFANNSIKNLTINNSSGVTLNGDLAIDYLKVSGIVLAQSGDLNSGGFLTLLSSKDQTALIDGTGTGQVNGDITMQRYLPSGFGYKYFSSPFSDATVAAFSSYLSTTATIPTFYAYDEENHRDSAGVNAYQSGWTKYLAGTLAPLSGYAANFGSDIPAKTVSITGTVLNGPMSVPLFNHNRRFTKGFNLVGNPYPSPIDWNKVNWTTSNIDKAIYFFNAGNFSQYTGIYTSYVGDISTGDGTNIIASMQGFFVHVSDGVFPVSATLSFSNSIRTNDLSPAFKAAIIDNRTILRFAASFETKKAIEDIAVIYFDDNANRSFEKDKDALKMLNTDELVPNLYSISTDPKQLSISGMPAPTDSITRIPLGITTLSDGWINFRAKDISKLPSNMHLYLIDAFENITQDLKQLSGYRFYLKKGEYNQRFTLVFSLSQIDKPAEIVEKMFKITRSGNQLNVNVNLPFNTKGDLIVTNMQGKTLLQKSVFEMETVEIDPNVGSGIYIVTMFSGKRKESEKILIRKDYE